MNRYIGIGKEEHDQWYSISLFLFDRMLKVKLYTPRTKKPTCYYYNKTSFDYCMNEQEIFNIKWFFGISLNCG
jgi:hypothetical protein